MVINDKIVFIPVPKNASWSVENTCIDYGFDLKYRNVLWENSIKLNVNNKGRHIHSTVDNLLSSFGNQYDYVCIIRNSTDRFISAWKFFISAMEAELNDTVLSDRIKKLDNSFVIDFIKENYLKLPSSYNSMESSVELLMILLNKMGIVDYLIIDENFKYRYSAHIVTFISQYQWIYNNSVNIKQFSFEKLNDFEKYISDSLMVDFKLIHENKTKLDYCAVTKTDELVLFVDKYIDGMYKQNKTII
jgi:hypothetical protein